MCFLIVGIHALRTGIVSRYVIWMESNTDSFLDPSLVPTRVTINELEFLPNGQILRLVGVL